MSKWVKIKDFLLQLKHGIPDLKKKKNCSMKFFQFLINEDKKKSLMKTLKWKHSRSCQVSLPKIKPGFGVWPKDRLLFRNTVKIWS